MKMVQNSVFQGGKLFLGAQKSLSLANFFLPPIYGLQKLKPKSMDFHSFFQISMKMVKNSIFQGGKLILGGKENFELSKLFSPTHGMGLRS